MVEYKYLSAEQRQHFLEHGWVLIPNAVRPEIVKEWTENIWDRLGYDPNDTSTWTEEIVWMPRHREILTKDFSPDAWQAMCELAGGEDRINMERESAWSGDQFICNFGSDYWKDHDVDPRDLQKINWHIDGDWYRHFLDSGENGLVVINVFADIEPRGGGTLVCEDGIEGVAKFLYDHPEGSGNTKETGMYDHIPNCNKFYEFTAKAGDTILIHTLLPHATSKNHLRNLRIITNPHVCLKDPLNLNRPNPEDHSLIEQVVLRAIGKTSLPPSEWKITGPREHYYPRNYVAKFARVKGELERMIKAAEKKGLGKDAVDSVYLKSEEELKIHKIRNGLTAPRLTEVY